jgi:hypothetical protein
MINRDELMHYRLQAWMRENKYNDIEYLGFIPDSIGVNKHFYRIADHKVSVDCIEDLELVEEQGDTI